MCYYATHLSPSNICATISNFCMRGGRSATRIDWESALLSPREAGLDRLNSFIRSLRVKNIQHNSDLRSLFIDWSWICSSFEAWKWIFLAAGAAQRKRRDWKWRMKNLRALAAKAVLPLTKYFLENLRNMYDEKGFGNDKWKTYKLWQCWQVYPFLLYLSVNSLIKMQEKSKLVRFCDDMSLFF